MIDLATKAKIRSQLAAQGIYWTDAEIDAYAEKNFAEPRKPQEPSVSGEYPDAPFAEDISPGKATAVEQGLDLVGSTLWNLLDVGTMGLAGWGWKSLDEESYEYAMKELHDTALGRIGGTVGGLAGFMVPMGWAKTGLSIAGRTAKGLIQGGDKAIKAGKVIANPTTRQAQKMAAKKIMDFSEEQALKSGGKALKWSEAKRMAIESSDDIMGFTNKGIMGKILTGKGPAYQMEHSLEFVNGVKQTMRSAMPGRLAASLKKYGVTGLREKKLLGLSDEVTELLATKPYNTIEAIIGSKYSTPIRQGVMDVLGAFGQEAIAFGIVGTSMDAIQYMKGDLDTSEKSFPSRMLHHTLIGGMFGPLKFIPGGSGAGAWKTIRPQFAKQTKALNKSINKMGLDETKAFAKMTLQNDKSAIFRVGGKNLTANDLRKGMGVTKEQLPLLKNEMIKHNKQLLSDYFTIGNLVPEVARDMLGSLPRMTAGSIIFNWTSLEDGAFEHLGRGEAAFHLGLGAIMTKGGRPLHRGGQVRKGFHFGERPYYYNSELKDVYDKMTNMNIM